MYNSWENHLMHVSEEVVHLKDYVFTTLESFDKYVQGKGICE